MKSEETELTSQQELFCQFYGQLSDTYSNGTWSYALAYGHDLENADKDDYVLDDKGMKIIGSTTYDKIANTCAVSASRLLRNAKIIERIQVIKTAWIDDDNVVDAKLMDIIQKGKYTDAMAAIKHRNDLKQRVTKKVKIDVETANAALLKEYGILGGQDDGKADEAVSRPSESTA